jgi:UDPglucose 6-dehydrogenase
MEADIIFICLPTLLGDKGYNLESFNEVLKFYDNSLYKGDIVIKSTCLPTTCSNFQKEYINLNICHNPEFLSAATAYEDFNNQKHIVIGGYSDKLINLYKTYFPNSEISIMTTNESESLKIFANSFYAVKIQFFNELYDMCEKIENCNYNTIIKGIIKNGWVNESHTNVPGSDGKLSFGGACFPKDTRSLLYFLKYNNIKSSVLDATVKENIEMRG